MEKNEKINLIYASHIIINNNNSYSESSKARINDNIKKKRYYIFDNFKGILIFMVVFAHFLFEYSKTHTDSLSRKIVVYILYYNFFQFEANIQFSYGSI